MIGDIGSKHTEVLHEMLPCLISFLDDETPAVARQAVTTGTALFCHVLEKLVIQACFFFKSYNYKPVQELFWLSMRHY